MSDTCVREVRVLPAYDLRHKPDYGVGSAKLLFLLRGRKGVVQFLVYTGWHLSSVVEDFRTQYGPPPVSDWRRAQPVDLGEHAYLPQYPGQAPFTEACDVLNGARCYYDGTSHGAEELYWRMIAEGDAAVWEVLQQRYDALIGPEEVAHADA
jgi:hypothetical protein